MSLAKKRSFRKLRKRSRKLKMRLLKSMRIRMQEQATSLLRKFHSSRMAKEKKLSRADLTVQLLPRKKRGSKK